MCKLNIIRFIFIFLTFLFGALSEDKLLGTFFFFL